jgi:phosphoribosylamine--glycine ligase
VDEANDAARAALADQRFGQAGARLVVEECLIGPEVSFFALVDGQTALPLASAQDHKRAFDGDQGPNTGGMGAYSPSPLVDAALEGAIMDRIIRPTVAGMAEMGRPFTGVLYAGLILTVAGPKLLEYNVRFGDPECQVLMRRLGGDLVPALIAAADGDLASAELAWSDEAAVGVVLAAKGYPGAYEKGTPIRGILEAEAVPGAVVFHAGTRLGPEGGLEAAGGRVLTVTATGPSIAEAAVRAYQAVDRIDWPGGFCRRDIAAKTAG